MTLTSAIPVLRVADFARARAFWTQKLGFMVTEEGGDPPRFGIFERDSQRVFLDAWHGPVPEGAADWRLYFHTDDIDATASAIIATGQALNKPVELTAYCMREFEIIDPDGNRLCFGQTAS
jgi:predicted enzyme related to lactoylglutathione lyase